MAFPVDPSRSPDRPWPVGEPFIERRTAGAGDIDEFGHVNNVRYVAWALEVAWAHSQALGLGFEDYRRLGVGCVVWRHEFDYLAPVIDSQTVDVGTWIAENDGRARLLRAFEMRDAKTGRTVLRGQTRFVTIDMASGRPVRMPPEFVAAYAPTL